MTETSGQQTPGLPEEVEPTSASPTVAPTAGLDRLAERGVVFSGTLIADQSTVLSGGVDDGASAFRHLLDLSLEVDTQLLSGHPGGTFFVNGVTQNGEDGSEEVGDFQAFSNIDTPDFTTVYELWYEQVFAGGQYRLKIGKVDANSEFAFVEYGGEFVNSSPGFSPTILSFPSYPDPATSVNVFAYGERGMYVGFGLYDGALQEGVSTGQRGPSTFFGSPADLFLIGEVGIDPGLLTPDLPGRLGMGVWHHTGTFDRFDGGQDNGTTGGYLVLDQLLYRENPGDAEDDQGLGAFLQYGWADEAVSEAHQHLGFGAQWSGLIPDRDDDIFGLMMSSVWFSDAPVAGFTEDAEWAFEAFIKLQVTPLVSVKPDVQYIVNPGGDASLENAWVGTLRLEVSF